MTNVMHGCEECGTLYLPKRTDQRYCTTRCNHRVLQRELRARRKAARLENSEPATESIDTFSLLTKPWTLLGIGLQITERTSP